MSGGTNSRGCGSGHDVVLRLMSPRTWNPRQTRVGKSMKLQHTAGTMEVDSFGPSHKLHFERHQRASDEVHFRQGHLYQSALRFQRACLPLLKI